MGTMWSISRSDEQRKLYTPPSNYPPSPIDAPVHQRTSQSWCGAPACATSPSSPFGLSCWLGVVSSSICYAPPVTGTCSLASGECSSPDTPHPDTKIRVSPVSFGVVHSASGHNDPDWEDGMRLSRSTWRATIPPLTTWWALPTSRTVLHAALVSAAYYLGAQVSFALRLPSSPTSTVWLPSAILLVALVISRFAVRPPWCVSQRACPVSGVTHRGRARGARAGRGQARHQGDRGLAGDHASDRHISPPISCPTRVFIARILHAHGPRSGH
jgi:hypothetical protein